MIYDHDSYLAPLDYLVSSYIREYDISKANINILLYDGLINQDQYNYYANMDKEVREKVIGWLQRDNPVIKNSINTGFAKVRKLFFEANDIKDNEVLSIKKDGIYLINKIAHTVDIANFHFKCKTYTSFYKAKKLEFYYFSNNASVVEYIDVKGISDKVLPLHGNYFLEFLLVLFNSAQSDPIEETIGIIQTFYNSYINYELDVGYYRNFNHESFYTFKNFNSIIGEFKSNAVSENQKRYLDISHNATIIQELYKIYCHIYFQTKK